MSTPPIPRAGRRAARGADDAPVRAPAPRAAKTARVAIGACPEAPWSGAPMVGLPWPAPSRTPPDRRGSPFHAKPHGRRPRPPHASCARPLTPCRVPLRGGQRTMRTVLVEGQCGSDPRGGADRRRPAVIQTRMCKIQITQAGSAPIIASMFSPMVVIGSYWHGCCPTTNLDRTPGATREVAFENDLNDAGPRHDLCQRNASVRLR